MQKDELRKRLEEILMAEAEGVDTNAPFEDIPCWNSLSQISIMSFLSRELQLEVLPAAIQECTTVTEILDLVEAALDRRVTVQD